MYATHHSLFLLHILFVKNNIYSTRLKSTLHIVSQQLKVYRVDSNWNKTPIN